MAIYRDNLRADRVARLRRASAREQLREGRIATYDGAFYKERWIE